MDLGEKTSKKFQQKNITSERKQYPVKYMLHDKCKIFCMSSGSHHNHLFQPFTGETADGQFCLLPRNSRKNSSEVRRLP